MNQKNKDYFLDDRRSEKNDRHNFEKYREKFISFVNNLDSNKRVAILAHGNCSDGMASAVLMIEILKKLHPSMPVPISIFLSYSIDMFGESLRKKLISENISSVFVLDIGMNPQNISQFNDFSHSFSVFYIDHHPSDALPNFAKVIKTESADCATLTIYRLAKDIFDEFSWIWLVCAAAVSEFSYKKETNLNFIQKYYPEFNRNDLESSELFKLSNALGSLIMYYKEKPLKALEIIQKKDFKKMAEINKEISLDIEKGLSGFDKAESYDNGELFFYNVNSKFDISSSISTILSMKYLGKTIIIFSKSWSDSKKIKISARNNLEPPPYSMKDLIESGIVGLSESTGGGHVPAAGGVILERDMDIFKRRVLEFVKSKLK